jgi:uncharacterized protein
VETARPRAGWGLRAAASREVILTGELHATKAAALNAVEAARVNAEIDRRYQRRVSTSSGLPYFVLCSASQEVLATSQVYPSALLRNRAIAELKANARAASVEDETHPRARRLALASAASAENDDERAA